MSIAVITTSRADWNGLGMVARALRADRGLAGVIAFGRCDHLPEVHEDVQTSPVEEVLAGNAWIFGTFGILEAMGALLKPLGAALERLEPTAVVLLGDRHETLLAAYVVSLMGLPIIHIAGGDTTQGSSDDGYRHAISKLAHLHFATTGPSTARLVQMGEDPKAVHWLGSPSIDRIKATNLMTPDELSSGYGVPAEFILVNWQPETVGDGIGLVALIEALREVTVHLIWVGPNQDPGAEEAEALVNAAGIVSDYWRHVPGKVYLSLLKHCLCLVGNSSSAYYEAPFLKTWAVDVGDRQAGRDKPASVIRVGADAKLITSAIGRAILGSAIPASEAYFYGLGDSAERIVKVIAKWIPNRRKVFHRVY